MSRLVAAAAALGLLAIVAGCGGSAARPTAARAVASAGGDFRIDDHDRHGAVCGVGDDDNSCPGAVQMAVVPNPRLREYAVVWQGWYTGRLPSDAVLYARRFDAATGRPKGPSVALESGEVTGTLAAAYDSATRTYVIATQSREADGPAFKPIRVQRIGETLHANGTVLTLGRWTLKTLAVEPRGLVAVVGAENEQAVNVPPRPTVGLLALRVETLNARNRIVSVARRKAGVQAGYADSVAAAYDSASHSLMLAWVPLITGVGGRVVRIDTVTANGGGTTTTIPLNGVLPVGGINLACSVLRRDCLLLYAPGYTHLADLHARLLGANGRALGRDLTIARGTRGPIGAAATATGYTFAWNQGYVTPPLRTHIVAVCLSARLHK